jgi:hypothetical protein
MGRPAPNAATGSSGRDAVVASAAAPVVGGGRIEVRGIDRLEALLLLRRFLRTSFADAVFPHGVAITIGPASIMQEGIEQ